MTTRLTILYKGLILIAVPLFFQLLFIAFVFRMRVEGTLAEDWTIHTKEVMVQAQNCRIQLLLAHASIQGFTLTRDPEYEMALVKATTRTLTEIDRLKSVVMDNPAQVKTATQIESAARTFLSFMAEGRQLIATQKLSAEVASIRRRAAQTMLEGLERDFDTFLAAEQSLDQQRHERLLKSWATFDKVLIGGVGCSFLFTVALSILYSRNISRRITSLTDNAQRLADGKTLLPPIAGGDEISQLDRVFHRMAQTLSVAAERERAHAAFSERRAEELNVINGQLNEKAQENEMFVYSVSHDLRSPLVNLQGFSRELQILGKDLGTLIEDEQVPETVRHKARFIIDTDMAESIHFIQSAVTRLSAIIDALLRLSRAGRVVYRLQKVSVVSAVNRIVLALRGTIEERAATITVGELPPAIGDSTAIEQVFANLIGNAVNYLDKTRPGRIEVNAQDLEAHLARVGPGMVVYAVSDNGLGIPDQYKSKIFTAFQRLHGDVAKGEGVGLAMVRRVVERQNGRIWFESTAGVGSTFFVALPAAETYPQGSNPAMIDQDSFPEVTLAERGATVSWETSR